MRRRSRLAKIPATGGGGGGGSVVYDTPTHYVSNSGTATWANATNPATPCSAATAMANADDDNVVQFATGRYTLVGTDSRSSPALNPAYSGSAGHPITFQTDQGVVDFQFSSGMGPVFGANQRSYITWRGFMVDEDLCPGATGDESACVLWTADHCVIEDCTFDGNGDPIYGDSLHSAIRIDGATGHDHTIRYNYMYSFRDATDSAANCAGILVLDCGGTNIIEHNEIGDCNCGWFIKRSWEYVQGKWHFRYNYVHDCYTGTRQDQLGNDSVDESVDIYQNLFKNITGHGVSTRQQPGGPSKFIRWVNNTFVNCDVAGLVFVLNADASHVFWNNILVDCDTNVATGDTLAELTQALVDAEHNCYHGHVHFLFENLDISNSPYRSFSDWQTAGQDTASPEGQEADPLFTNEAGGVYTLQAESPARQAGIDMLNLQGGGTSEPIDCGCYVTGTETIGRG